MCAIKLRKEARFCYQCQSDQSTVGPPNWNQPSSIQGSSTAVVGVTSQPTSSPSQQSFGRPLMSFEAFHKSKTSNKSESQGPSKKKAKVQDQNVTINIGMKRLVDEALKNVHGKRLPLTISKDSNYAHILEKAVPKFKAFDRNFNHEVEYVLLYDDGQCAQFMPGDFFNLEEYRMALGKDYKHITLYLCSCVDHLTYEGFCQEQIDIPDFDYEQHVDSDMISCIPDLKDNENLIPIAFLQSS